MKIRTQAIVSLVRIRDTCQSDNSTSEDSADEKPGVIIGNNAGNFSNSMYSQQFLEFALNLHRI